MSLNLPKDLYGVTAGLLVILKNIMRGSKRPCVRG